MVCTLVLLAGAALAVLAPRAVFGRSLDAPGGEALAAMAGGVLVVIGVLAWSDVLRGSALLTTGRVLVVLSTLVLVTGTVLYHYGWSHVYVRQDTPPGDALADSLYHALRLITLNVDGPAAATGEPPVAVWVGNDARRFVFLLIALLAPLLALSGVLATVTPYVRLLAYRLRSGHLVTVGAGGRGLAFSKPADADAHTAGRRPIVVDADAARQDLVEAAGCDFLEGDARSPQVLRRAGVKRAATVVIATSSERRNALIARAAVEAGARPEHVIVHTGSAPLGRSGGAGQPYDLDATIATGVLEKLGAARTIVIVGPREARVVRNVVLAVARKDEGPGAARTRVRLVGDAADALRADLAAEPVVLSSAVELGAVDVDLCATRTSSSERARLVDAVDRYGPEEVVVATGDDDLTADVTGVLERSDIDPELVVRVLDGLDDVPWARDVTAQGASSHLDMLDKIKARTEDLKQSEDLPELEVTYGLDTPTPGALRPALAALLKLPDEQEVARRLNIHHCGITRVRTQAAWARAAACLDTAPLKARDDSTRRRGEVTAFVAWCEAVRATLALRPARDKCPACDALAAMRREAARRGEASTPASHLLLAIAEVLHAARCPRPEAADARDRLAATLREHDARLDLPSLADRTLIVAGCARALPEGCDDNAAAILRAALATRFREGEEGFAGEDWPAPDRVTVFGPGTPEGVGGALSAIAADLGGAALHAVVPEDRTAQVAPPASAIGLRASAGRDHSVLEPVTLWANLLADSDDPSEVVEHAALLAFVSGDGLLGRGDAEPGCRVTVGEVVLARALGVPRVAWVDLDPHAHPGTRQRVLEELVPDANEGVVPLVPDRMTVRAWLHEHTDPGCADGPLAAKQDLDPDEVLALAEVLHAQYTENERQRGRSADDAAMPAWRELTEGLKRSNFAAARDWVEKRTALAGSGLRLADLAPPRADAGAPPATTVGHALNLLAEMEHGRYVAERQAAGWRYGDRSVALQRTRTLVSWDELGPDDSVDRDRDRSLVRTCCRWHAEKRGDEPFR